MIARVLRPVPPTGHLTADQSKSSCSLAMPVLFVLNHNYSVPSGNRTVFILNNHVVSGHLTGMLIDGVNMLITTTTYSSKNALSSQGNLSICHARQEKTLL
jgi:hypothetical protein